jgi:hypothetical protein
MLRVIDVRQVGRLRHRPHGSIIEVSGGGVHGNLKETARIGRISPRGRAIPGKERVLGKSIGVDSLKGTNRSPAPSGEGTEALTHHLASTQEISIAGLLSASMGNSTIGMDVPKASILPFFKA